MENWVKVYKSALKEALKHVDEVNKDYAQQLEYFIHDWMITVEEENRCICEGEETPSRMFENFKNQIKRN